MPYLTMRNKGIQATRTFEMSHQFMLMSDDTHTHSSEYFKFLKD